MKTFQKLWKLLTRQTPETGVRQEPIPAPPPEARPERQAVPSRPAASSLTRAVDLLRDRPDLTARELAEELSLTPAYTRTLLKRAKAKLASEPAAAPVVPSTLPLAVVGSWHRETPRSELADLQARLEQTERSLEALCSTPVQVRGTWNLRRRAEVIRLAGNGIAMPEIAASLSIPGGEVDFILKVDRLLHGNN